MAGDTTVIRRVRHFRRMYGGGMRQAGILAAAGIYALDHHIPRLKQDHEHAKRLATLLRHIPALAVNPDEVETNIVLFEVKTSQVSSGHILSRLKQAGVLINCVGGMSFRAVTHLDISADDIERAGHIFAEVLKS